MEFAELEPIHSSEVLPDISSVLPSSSLGPARTHAHRPQSSFAMLHIQHHRQNNQGCMWPSFARLGHVYTICHRSKAISAPHGRLQSIVNAQLLSSAFPANLPSAETYISLWY